MSKTDRTIQALFLLVAAVFLSLHALHLGADFPNNSPWMDWSKYTDEGWYGNAAIQHYLRGNWYVAGDFNPAVALPVWPLLAAAVFHFTGVSVVAVRALAVGVFALILVAANFLLRRYNTGYAPAVAVLLLAVSPFCYAFSRLAILEPLLILLTLLALLAASAAREHRVWPTLLLGLLLPLMVLTKTTAIFLVPAVFYLLWCSLGCRLAPFLRASAQSGLLSAAIWCSYYVFLVLPHYLQDYSYLFSANSYTWISLGTFWSVVQDTLQAGNWMGRILYPLSLVLMILAVVLVRALWRHPLFTALALWMAGYLAFLAYHNNMQPRYYLVVAVPMTMLVALGADHLLQQARLSEAGILGWALPMAVGAALAFSLTMDAVQTLHFVRTPDYTFERAAQQVKRVVDSEPSRSKLVLSISGSDLSLFTGLPSICDDFGTMDLVDRIAVYRPGWYVAWNDVEPDKLEALTKFYKLDKVAEFPALDDPERNLMIVYRLLPLPPTHPSRHPKTRKLRLLQTGMHLQSDGAILR